MMLSLSCKHRKFDRGIDKISGAGGADKIKLLNVVLVEQKGGKNNHGKNNKRQRR